MVLLVAYIRILKPVHHFRTIKGYFFFGADPDVLNFQLFIVARLNLRGSMFAFVCMVISRGKEKSTFSHFVQQISNPTAPLHLASDGCRNTALGTRSPIPINSTQLGAASHCKRKLSFRMPGQRIWRRERLLLGPKECLSLDVGHGHGHGHVGG